MMSGTVRVNNCAGFFEPETVNLGDGQLYPQGGERLIAMGLHLPTSFEPWFHFHQAKTLFCDRLLVNLLSRVLIMYRDV